VSNRNDALDVALVREWLTYLSASKGLTPAHADPEYPGLPTCHGQIDTPTPIHKFSAQGL
jgi:hypothetical protein